MGSSAIFRVVSVIIVIQGLFFPVRLFSKNPVAGFVDFGQMLLAHPEFRDFFGGNVEFSGEAKINKEEIFSKMKLENDDANQEFLKLKKEKDPARRLSRLERFWAVKTQILQRKKEFLEKHAAIKKSKDVFWARDKNIEELNLVCKNVIKSIRETVSQISLSHGKIPVLDLSCFFPYGDLKPLEKEFLFSNYHFSIWQGDQTDFTKLKSWLYQLRLFLRDEYPRRFSTPFIHGFIDLRNESVRLLSIMNRN
ncbi:hypothetical protein HYY75_03175 [bacterium]|nr:hypothetical protein [bacterium]